MIYNDSQETLVFATPAYAQTAGAAAPGGDLLTMLPMLIGFARDKGVAVYTGEGLNQWPAVHRFDAATVYRLALERGVGGERYHAIAEQGVLFRDIAGLIGRRLNLPVASKTPEEAAQHFAWFANFAAMDVPASSAHTRSLLGWTPTQPGLLADVDQHYFAS